MKVIKHGGILAYIFYKKIKSLGKRSAAIGLFGAALPPPCKKFLAANNQAKTWKPAEIRGYRPQKPTSQ